jgi:hydroxymethylglutaryl-CoA reductase (NADPH)
MSSQKMPSFSQQEAFSKEASTARRKWAATHSGVNLDALDLDEDGDAYVGNIENLMGFVRLPVGLAGPLHLRGQHAAGEFLVPLATTEGTLAASYNRGMRAIRESGGAQSAVTQNEIFSSVTFLAGNPENAQALAGWLNENASAVAETVAAQTRHGRFLRSESRHFGSRLIVNFFYDPADAMGINMITNATRAVCQMISDARGGMPFFLPSGLQGDKKATAHNFLQGRGRSVVARVLLAAEVIRGTLRSSAEGIMAYHRNNVETSALTGGLGYNMHIANGITALGLATGQDVAYVSESSNGQLVLEEQGEDLLVELSISSLYVGTVGGGTGLPTHRPLLEMMGCTGPGSALKLAEIFAGTCLAGEISVLAAIASDQFVNAHNALGRNRPGG